MQHKDHKGRMLLTADMSKEVQSSIQMAMLPTLLKTGKEWDSLGEDMCM